MIARLPIYGTIDASCGFYLRMNGEITSGGLKCSKITPALYYLRNPKGELIGVIATHVDDLLYCYLDEGKNLGKSTIENILKKFTIGKTEGGKFRYCGRQFVQREDFSVNVSTREGCKTVKPIEIDKNRKLTDKVTEKELPSLRSVVGSLA